jgi:hypothetical protein
MLASRAAGVTILIIGVTLMVFALLADSLDIGGGEGFGYQQMIVFIAGMVAVLFGGAILLQPRHDDQDPPYTSDPDNEP